MMRKVVDDKLKTQQMNIHHHMVSTILAEFRRLCERSDVSWVQYRGHLGNFAVKLHDKLFVTYVLLNSNDLSNDLK